MSTGKAEDAAGDGDDGRTTVLPPGVVESRNIIDPTKSCREISTEIRAFLSGDGAAGPVSEIRSFFTVWMFVSRLPSPSRVDLHPGYLMRGMSYFPVAGSVLGAASSIVYDSLRVSAGLPSPAAATIAVAFGLCLTGCFHEDGLADTFDGMGGWSRSQVLRIMTDSRVGTFGVASLSLFLLLKSQLLGHVGASVWAAGDSSGAGPAILAAQTLSRVSAPYLIRTRDYVAEVGPKSPFYLFMVEARHIVTWPRVCLAAAYGYAVTSALYGPAFAAALLSAVLAASHAAGSRGDYLLGGVMGDFLGCTVCLCEVIVLALIAARGPIAETCREIEDSLLAGGGGSPGGSFRDPVRRMATLYGNDRVRPLANLALLMAALKLWCKFVGPPDMYDREDKKKEDPGKKY